ncbi:MAG: 5,6-dimethylbenzimidazole synthase [Bryobacterales bacterium]
MNPELQQVQNGRFDAAFREQFDLLLRSRRDVRHFRTDPVDPALVERLLQKAMLAPSVGFSQPWRWVLVENPEIRSAIAANHDLAKDKAGSLYDGEQSRQYQRLKLAGLNEAPVHVAVFADGVAVTGHGLGRQTMPGTLLWSVVMAIYALWLAAAAEGLGVGWVSILDPKLVATTLAVPREWTFVAYLCLGWPEEYTERPLLETNGWETRQQFDDVVFRR